MHKASLQLQRLIECYLSYSYDFSVCKLLPASYAEKDGCTDNFSAAVYTAQEYLEYLPCLLQGSSIPPYNEFDEEERQLLRFLSSALLRALNHHASRCCGETTNGSDAMSKRSAFIIWMVLSVYSNFAQEAERRSPNWHRVESSKEVVFTSSVKARYQVLAGWLERRYAQKRHDSFFAEFPIPAKPAFQQSEVKPAAFEGASSQTQDRDVDEEEGLWCEVESLFNGEKGELIDPLAADQNLFLNFFLDHVDPVLQRYSRWGPSACTSPFPSLHAKDSDVWRRECLAYARCQFKVHPFSPEASIIEAVVAATAYTLPCLKKVGVFAEYWEKQYVDWANRQSDKHVGADDAQPSAKEKPMPDESLSRPRSGSSFAMDYASSLYQALSVAQGSVQLIPSSIRAEEVEGGAFSEASPAPSHLCGSWLAAAAALSPGCARRHRLLQPSRVGVVFPGLAVAAVEIVSASLEGVGPAGVSSPDALVGAGTMVVSPPSARARLALPTLPDEGAGAGVRILSSAALHPSACVIPLRRLPEFTQASAEGTPAPGPGAGNAIPPLKLTDLIAVVGSVREGVVLVLVEAHVGKREQRLMEAWGTGARAVVVVGSIGEWGMSQLSLRWRTPPNTPFTEPSKLRCIRDGKVGVLLYPLDEMDITMPYDASTKGSRKRMALDVVERRTRWLVVIGECECADRRRLLGDLQVDRTFSMSIPVDDDTSERTSRTSSENSATNSTSLSSQDMEDAVCADSPPLPFFGHVMCSVLVGGATDALQRRGLLMVRVVRQHLVHRAVLPERLGSLLPTADGRVELGVLDHVRQLRTTIFPFTGKSVGDRGVSTQPEATVLFHARILEAMEGALQSYLMSCAQHDLGLQVEEAWRRLNQVHMSVGASVMEDAKELLSGARVFVSTNNANVGDGDDVAGEVYFTVRSAYLAIASCLDELCHTALMGSHASNKASPHQGFASEDLYFFPLIE